MAGYSAMSVQMTKKAINRSLDIAGMRQALLAAIDTATLIEANVRPENVEFERIRSTEGMQAALAWRDAKTKT
jgi:enoyl-CoA hydratase